MLDLSRLHGRQCDLVYQAVSACYVPDVQRLYREVARVIKPGGWYRVEHWNPVHLQLPDDDRWDGAGYRVTRPQWPRHPIPYTNWDENTNRPGATCWHFFHSLGELLGAVCEEGFVIERFGESDHADIAAEPGSYLHLAAYLPSFFLILARRRA